MVRAVFAGSKKLSNPANNMYVDPGLVFLVNTIVIYDHVSDVSFSFFTHCTPPTHRIHPEPSYADCAVCLFVRSSE
jgi:hypothetical protein